MSRSRRPTTTSVFVLVTLMLGVVLSFAVPAAQAAERIPIPSGYGMPERHTLAPGVERIVLVGGTPRQVVNVARIAPDADVVLRAGLSHNRVAGPGPRLETTSSMCARLGCVAGINADYHHLHSNMPVGGKVSLSEMLKSPHNRHHQLIVTTDGRLAAGILDFSGNLMTTDLKRAQIDGINVDRVEGSLILYTPAFGPSTGQNPHGVELVAEVIAPAPPIRLGQTVRVRAVELRDGVGDTPLPPGRIVLSGHGAAADTLRAAWANIGNQVIGSDLLLRLESNPGASESVGGAPVVVRNGEPLIPAARTSFTMGRHPRSLAGWTQDGHILLVTVDGRQPGHSAGMTLPETAHLMVGLGAVEAINLDGGGSTTFVAGGHVRNRPSGGAERPVSSALLAVPRTSGPVPNDDPLTGGISLPASPSASSTVESGSVSLEALQMGSMPVVVWQEPAGRDWAPTQMQLGALAVFLAAVALALSGMVFQPQLRLSLQPVRTALASSRSARLVARSLVIVLS